MAEAKTMEKKTLERMSQENFKNLFVNPQAPVVQKSTDEVGFRHFQCEGVDFFNRTSLTPAQIFYAHLLENTDSIPFRYHFPVGFISR